MAIASAILIAWKKKIEAGLLFGYCSLHLFPGPKNEYIIVLASLYYPYAYWNEYGSF